MLIEKVNGYKVLCDDIITSLIISLSLTSVDKFKKFNMKFIYCPNL